MNNSVQSFNFGNIAVSFREDGYLNATQIAAHFGKLPKDYLKTEQTQQYISALVESLSEVVGSELLEAYISGIATP